jgi:hypothetical protein
MRRHGQDARQIIRTLTKSAHGRSGFPFLRKALRYKEKAARDSLSRAA